MTALADAATLRRPSLAVVPAGLACGALVGFLVAMSPLAGLGLLCALIYAPLAMVNLPLAVGLWMPLLFLEGLPGSNMLPEAGAAVIAIVWLGEAIRPDSWQRQQLQRHRRLLMLIGVFMLWLGLSLVWAEDPGKGVSLLFSGVEVAVFFTLVATIPSQPSHLRVVAAGFVTGTVLSALVGILGEAGGIAAVDQEGRLQGASGDPNYFAAQLVAGLALALGLLATTRRPGARVWLLASLVPLAYGIVASQSRGGFVALAVAGIASIIIFRRHRTQVAILVVGVTAVMGIWLTTNTAAWTRITSAEKDRGSGREDLWAIALRMAGDHPIAGVGLSNYSLHSPDYTREPGTLTGVGQVERHQEAHNAYLSLLAETGIVGLALFILVAATTIASGARAASRFDALGDHRAAIITQAALVALIGMLSSAAFLSNSEDKRIWVLMGLAIACLGVAQRTSAADRDSVPSLSG